MTTRSTDAADRSADPLPYDDEEAAPVVRYDIPASKYLIWDLETAGLPLDELERRMPDFTKNIPKTINKEETKREHIATKQREWLQRAALDSYSGQIVMSNFKYSEGDTVLLHEGACGPDGPALTEQDICQQTSDILHDAIRAGRLIVGFNSPRFDGTYFLCRCAAGENLVTPSPLLRYRWRGREYWHEAFYDLQDRWNCGYYDVHREGARSLYALALHTGCEPKAGLGSDFPRLWVEERDTAIWYGEQDLHVTEQAAAALGVIKINRQGQKKGKAA